MGCRSSAKPSAVTEAQAVSVAAGWVADRVSARLQQKFEWYPLLAGTTQTGGVTLVVPV
jgi:hypothetical protein